MTRISLERGERLFVIGLLAVVTASAVWIREAAEVAEAETIRREHLLQTLQQQRIEPNGARRFDPSRFDALFEGRQLSWQEGPAGRCLALRAGPEAR